MLTIKKSYISFLYSNIQIPRKSKVHFLPIIRRVFPNPTFVNNNSLFWNKPGWNGKNHKYNFLKTFSKPKDFTIKIYEIHDFLQIGREGNGYSIWK